MTGDAFRDIALGLDGVVEAAHMGHPDFRANGRIFASLRADERTGMVKLTPEQQAELMRQHPTVRAVARRLGPPGLHRHRAARGEAAAVRPAMLLAYQAVMSVRRPRRESAPARERG